MNSFAEGQVWRYRTREGEEASRLFIAKVDTFPSQLVFHIALDALRLQNPHLASGVQANLPHAPVSEEALKASVTSLEAEHAAMPDISEGYAIWREEFDCGRASVFSISVAKVVEYIEDIVSKGHRDA